MTDPFEEEGSAQAGIIGHLDRDLLERALRIRCASYLSQVKTLLTGANFETDQSKSYVQKLNNLLLEQHFAIQQTKQELKNKNLALLEMKDQLESQVQLRTEELLASNKELQQEIQERHQIELALRDSENKFRSLLQSAPDAIVITREDGTIELVNEQTVKIFSYTPEELIGQCVDVLIPHQLRESHQAHRQNYLGNPYCRLMGDGQELYAQTKRGDIISVEVALSPLQTQKGMLVMASIRDISKRKQVEAELLTYREHLEELVAERTVALSLANKELEEFSYSVSHDLRAPLRSIDGFSLALLEDFDAHLPEDGKAYLRRIRGAAQRMGLLIDEVLDLARVSRCDLKKRNVDLTQLAKEFSEDLQINNPARNVTITVGEGLKAMADENLVRVVLENLLDNAWKFTSRHSLAEITFDQLPDTRIFYVKDNGVGMNMRYVDKLFSPFQRLHSDKDFPGTGVGLATVYRIIQRHGGRIWVESKPNQGATFYFTLDE